MMMNLFGIFDPKTLFFTNWISMFMVMGMFMSSLYIISFNTYSIMTMMIKYIYFEMSSIVNNKKESFLLVILSLMFFILLNNMMGLAPYMFTASSHMIYALSLALFLWLISMMLNFFKTINHLLIHLTPMGTPIFLMFFMVCIESLSLLIRPLTLAIRLMANMVAGHLLMVLLSNLIVSLSKSYLFLTSAMTMILLILEFSVSIIQSYVFSILLLLYLNESF